jgi:CHASE2 domain-containing sensor protein
VPSTVLIATPEHLPALKAQEDLAGAQAFSDNEALRALEAITRQRPAIVALDKLFAASSRGGALINRIKADPSLTACEIRIVEAGPATSIAPPAPKPSAGAPAPLGPLDYRGTRRAARFRVVDGIEVSIDGNPATLQDLSLIGAMVISPTILRPNQRVRMSLPDRTRPIRFGAGVAWAAFELLKTGPRYRAGIEFFDADAAAVQRFIDANKKP